MSSDNVSVRFAASVIRRAATLAWLALATVLAAACGGGGGGDDADDQGGGSAVLPELTLTRIAAGFSAPVHIAHAGDGSGRLFVVERAGLVHIVRNGVVAPTPFLDISSRVNASGSEQGLLSIAFPPDFARKRHFYVNYSGLAGIADTVVARVALTADDQLADPASETALLTVVQPFANHNGGQLAFGPDGLLYVGVGDGGSGGDPQGNAQNLNTLLGKLLRLDVESAIAPYAIPPGNPFGDEIWAYGLRNPWRFSFDRANGELYIGDVGQGAIEEIDFQPASSRGGENYGWNRMEGLQCFGAAGCDQRGLTLPVLEYDHSAGDCAVTGGFVYRGAQNPALQGTYLYADFCSGRLWGLKRNAAGAWENTLLLDSTLQISSFGEDESGNIYLADLGGGGIYRLELR